MADANRLELKSIDNAFTRGGNRLCFVHPEDSNVCVKTVRPDRTPTRRRQQKKFPKNLKPLSRFDENYQEWLEIKRIQHFIGDEAFQLIPQYYGLIDTDLGEGLSSEMIRDDDGAVSMSLKQYVWQNGVTEKLRLVLDHFKKEWVQLAMPSRDLLLHNIVVQQKRSLSGELEPHRLVVIDGLGWAGFASVFYWFKTMGQKKAKEKTNRLEVAIKKLLETKAAGGAWGYHGWLEDEQRFGSPNEQKDK